MYEIVTFGGNCVLVKKVDDGPFVNVGNFSDYVDENKRPVILKLALEIRDTLNAAAEIN